MTTRYAIDARLLTRSSLWFCCCVNMVDTQQLVTDATPHIHLGPFGLQPGFGPYPDFMAEVADNTMMPN